MLARLLDCQCTASTRKEIVVGGRIKNRKTLNRYRTHSDDDDDDCYYLHGEIETMQRGGFLHSHHDIFRFGGQPFHSLVHHTVNAHCSVANIFFIWGGFSKSDLLFYDRFLLMLEFFFCPNFFPWFCAALYENSRMFSHGMSWISSVDAGIPCYRGVCHMQTVNKIISATYWKHKRMSRLEQVNSVENFCCFPRRWFFSSPK